MSKSVLVAMSGGVDSAAAAYLLQQDGYEVAAAHIRVIDERVFGTAGAKSCCSLSDQVAARQAASQLGITLHVFNWEEEFKKGVLDYFIAEYLRGRTPNPCIVCNQVIKFGLLIAKAKELGFDRVATGHYARRVDAGGDSVRLLRGVDQVKDQSYVLSALTKEQLAAALFPVGEYNKKEIRSLLTAAGFLIADKPESQEICFIPDNDYRGFLQKWAGEVVAPGPIKDTEGRVLGEHRGVAFYTIGQRKGLNLAVGHPLYVKEIDVETRTLVVGEDETVFATELKASKPLWLVDPPIQELEVKVQIRYRHEAAQAQVKVYPDQVEVKFNKPQRGITPGQRAAFYQGERLLGGAWID